MLHECSVRYCYIEKKTIKDHFFPSNPIERERQMKAFPNILPKIPAARDMVVFVKIANYKTTRRKVIDY